MKAVIPENLTSVYELTVPYAFDVRKLRKQLDAELEKLHPCFPGQYTADYRLRLHPYGKGPAGFHIRAVVIDRLTLSALRKENAGCALYAACSHPYPVFSREILQKRLCLAAAVLAAVVTMLVSVHIIRGKTLPVERQAAGSSALTGIAGTIPGSSETDAFKSGNMALAADEMKTETADLSPFITGIYEQGGSLSAVSWDASSGTLAFSVEGLYPEQMKEASDFGDVRFGSVSYREGRPELEVTLASVFSATLGPAYGQSVPSDARQLFLESGGSLLSETVTPPSVTGSIPETGWASFAAGLMELTVSGFSLSRSGGSISVSLELSETEMPGGEAGLPELPFSDLSCVFCDAPGLRFELQPEDEWQKAVSGKREIGRIDRGDGTFAVFFHNEEGKIERRVYEE